MKKYHFFISNFHFLVVKFSVYLNRHVFVMADIKYLLRKSIMVIQQKRVLNERVLPNYPRF